MHILCIVDIIKTPQENPPSNKILADRHRNLHFVYTQSPTSG